MKIIYLAWGSLLWNYKGLKLKTKWEKTNLKLPLNFSRISDSGKGRLTLVIDQTHGDLNTVFYAVTKSNNLNDAIYNIRTREKTTKNNIGYITLNSKQKRSKNLTDYQENLIKIFLQENNFDAVIWTDLDKNFEIYEKVSFSKEHVFNYFNSKRQKTKTQILEYIVLSKIYGNISTNVGDYIINKQIC